MVMIRFTRPDGRSVSIIASAVISAREPFSGEMDPRAKTVLLLSSGGFQAVREPLADVEAALVKMKA